MAPAPRPAQLIALQPGAFEDDRARSCFEYFRLVSSSDLSRFSGPSAWCRSVLQMSHAFPAVRHAVLALAVLHRSFKDAVAPTPSTTQAVSGPLRSTWQAVFDPYAAREYQKAVRQLIRDISGSDKTRSRLISLICSALFAAIEVMQGNDAAALVHTEGAIKLLKDRPPANPSNGTILSDVEEEVGALYSRIDLETSLFITQRPPSLPCSGFLESEERRRGPFSDLSEASEALNRLMRHASYFIRTVTDNLHYLIGGDVPLEIYHQQQCLLDQAHQFGNDLTHLMGRLGPKNQPEDQAHSSLLQIHHALVLGMLRGCLNAEETVYDSCTAAFETIVRLSTALNQQHAGMHAFAMETGIIYPLYWTALRCRDGRLRREALHQVRLCSREGVWIPEIHACVAEYIVELEESIFFGFRSPTVVRDQLLPVCADIPEFFRVHSVSVNVDKSARQVAVMHRRRLNGPDGEWNVTVERLSF